MSVSVVILIVVVFSGQERMSGVGRGVEEAQARASLDKLADAADFVYSQATGASAEVYITVPQSVSEIIVGDHYFEFVLHLGGSNSSFNDVTTARLSGSIDSSAGSRYVVLKNEGAFVSVSGRKAARPEENED